MGKGGASGHRCPRPGCKSKFMSTRGLKEHVVKAHREGVPEWPDLGPIERRPFDEDIVRDAAGEGL